MASINFFYRSYCETFMTLNIDEKSLFITVPSESDGISYRVEMNEETMQAVKCSCQGFRYYHKCKHCTIVNDAYASCSQSFIVNAAMDEADALEEQYEEVALIEQVLAATEKDQTPLIVTKPVQPVASSSKIAPNKIVRIDHHSIRTARFFSALPSRQRKEVAC